MAVKVKRIYEKPLRGDGKRVLVDRLWPRGLRKDTAAVAEWMRELAPSDRLRQWFHLHPEAWSLFRQKYLEELGTEGASEQLKLLHHIANSFANVTLLFASRDLEHNNAVVLKELLDGMRKPPRGTGPVARKTRRSQSRKF
jgi:uncharacterized protein YeaO (DUF488 family)